MSQRKGKKKGQESTEHTNVINGPNYEVTKEDHAIAKYMKNNTPTKRTKFLHHQVDYFYASKAVNCLLDSKWATGKDPIFTDRESVVEYCDRLLNLKFFHRAKKIPITDKDLRPKDLKKKREREKKEKKKLEGEESEGDKKDDKKKKKIKLDMHLEQVFVDGSDAYVWMYDPIPFWYYIAGFLLLLSAVAVCLFPLWPPSVRKGVYYLSVAAAGFLGVILGLAVLRFIFFMIIWVLSMGRHHLWLLPNLTEDVGFFASFWPLYQYEYRGSDYDKKKKKSKKKVSLKTDEEKKETDNNQSATETDRQDTDCERTEVQHNSDSEASQHSQPFEIVDREDFNESSHAEEMSEEEE